MIEILGGALILIVGAAVSWLAWLLWGPGPATTDAQALLEVLRMRALGIPETEMPAVLLEAAERELAAERERDRVAATAGPRPAGGER